MEEFLGKDGSGKDIRFIRYDGLNYPVGVVGLMQNGGFKEQLEACRNLEVRQDDVFIPAYVKSGTHWLWDIVKMLQNKTTEIDVKHKESYMLDFQSPDNLSQLSSPRLLNMHFPLRYFPRQAIEKRCKILHIMRNPKDVFVSYYNHYNSIGVYDTVDSFSNFLPMMLGEHGYYLKCAWHEYELEWEKFGKDHPDYPILYLYYEDLKEDLEKWIGAVARFLELDVTEELIRGIAKQCQIDNHRKAFVEKKENNFIKDVMVDGNPLMFRKGTVGDWKNWFTVAENEKMDHWLHAHLTNTELKFRFEL